MKREMERFQVGAARPTTARVLRTLSVGVLVAVVWIGYADPAGACIHPESAFSGELRPSAQEYLLVYGEGQEVLVISTEIPETDEPIERLSLVTATPTLPDDYSTARADLFSDLYEWVYEPPRSGGGDMDSPDLGGDSGGNGFTVLPEVETGPYTITPIEVTGGEGVAALNDWLDANGFVTLPEGVASHYADSGWFFLAVDIEPPDTDTELAAGVLPPLQLSFAADAPVIPLLLEAGMGTFDIRIYAVLDRPLPAGFDGAEYGLSRHDDLYDPSVSSGPWSLGELLDERVEAGYLPDLHTWQISELHNDGVFNHPSSDTRIDVWGADFAIDLSETPGLEDLGGSGDPLIADAGGADFGTGDLGVGPDAGTPDLATGDLPTGVDAGEADAPAGTGAAAVDGGDEGSGCSAASTRAGPSGIFYGLALFVLFRSRRRQCPPSPAVGS